MIARASRPRIRALGHTLIELPHWASVDRETGRILFVTGTGGGEMPAALREQMNLQPISHADALSYHGDPVDRHFHEGRVGRCAPHPLRLATDAKARRTKLLAGTDYLMVPDAPITAKQVAAWRVYRQSLRDITKQPGYPGKIIWPVPPAK